jgi:predicted enzyme related to lactoylglutathione lyase
MSRLIPWTNPWRWPRSLGAIVCMEPMDVPGVGRMAAFNDPQGATISIIQYQSS